MELTGIHSTQLSETLHAEFQGMKARGQGQLDILAHRVERQCVIKIVAVPTMTCTLPIGT